MKKTALLFLCMLTLIGNSFAGPDLLIRESLVMQSRILKQPVRFSVCLPDGYYLEKKVFPVVYLLHGLGDNDFSWLEYGRISQYAEKAVASGDAVPMIFVMPEGYRTYYVNDYKSSFLYQDMFVKELVPYIDSLFRTVPDRQHRAVMGYSMGGFGAIILPMKHPEVFGTAVPLSMSVRNDEQYMTEDASGWDEQWGRLFGEPGLKGAARLTAYYRNNSPFYLLPEISAEMAKTLNIYMVNGDEEQTLCRSNEELHILMQQSGIAHEYRVTDGGHSFRVWCAAVPGALRFISDVFEGRPYRGELKDSVQLNSLSGNQFLTLNINNTNINAFVPVDYAISDRKFPVLYMGGAFSESEKIAISKLVNREITCNSSCPMLVVFLPSIDSIRLKTWIPLLEEKLRIRTGYRFRAMAGYQDAGFDALALAVNQIRFSSCVLADAFISNLNIAGLLKENKAESLKRMTLFIEAPDKGRYAGGNGNLHMTLRDMDVQHEYRVNGGSGGFDWLMHGLPEALGIVSTRFHR